MGDPTANPLNWTLRFKNHNVTIVLLISPVEPFGSVKKTLLEALRGRDMKEINGKTIPDDASEIEFGVPIDRNNLEKGWQKLEVSAQANGDEKRSTGGKGSVLNANPQGAGLRDFQAVAFRFRKPIQGEGDPDDDVAMELDDPGWDVLIPKYDEEEGD